MDIDFNGYDSVNITDELQARLQKLRQYLSELGSVAVGYSGGVDSTFLITVAHEVLGDKAIAVTGLDASVPERELHEASEYCKEKGIAHFVTRVDPLREEGYRYNSPDRCYYCKHTVFTAMRQVADENGIEYLAEGSNMDDLGDYRPGLQAVAELGVKSPLREAGLSKNDIRALSRYLKVPTWDKPSFACLASRFVYGEEITEEKLHMIDRAEQYLIDLGFRQMRVRMHGTLARIEVVPEEIERLAGTEMRAKIFDRFREIGFDFVTLDLKGYRTGSMNATL